MCHFYALLTVLIWSTAYIGTPVVSASYSAGALGLLRCLSAAAALAAITLALRLPRPRARDLPFFALSGLTGMALYLVLFNSGFATIGPTTSCVIVALSPVLSALLAAALFRERLTPLGWFAIGAAFCGILLMALWEGTMRINIGVVWTALAALSFAVYNLLQRKLGRGYDPRVITAYSFAAGAVFLLPYLFQAARQMRAAPPNHTLVVLFLGVFPSAIAYLLWVKALAIAPKTSYVTNYMFVTPFASLVLELWILRQWPDMGAVLGGIVILASLALFAAAGKRQI